MNESLPPRHVAIAGSIVLAAAIFFLSHIVMGSRLLDLPVITGIVFLTLSWGIFVGRRFPWGWVAVIGGLILMNQCSSLNELRTGRREWLVPDSVHEMMISGLVIVLSLYVFFAATFGPSERWSEQQRDKYGDKPKASPETKRLIACVAAVSVAFTLLYHVEDWRGSETLRRTYAINTHIIPYDEETGKEVPDFDFPRGPKTSAPGKVTLPYYDAREQTMNDGGTVKRVIYLHGIASNPFLFRISAEGYEPQFLPMDRGFSEEIRVPMKRKK